MTAEKQEFTNISLDTLDSLLDLPPSPSCTSYGRRGADECGSHETEGHIEWDLNAGWKKSKELYRGGWVDGLKEARGQMAEYVATRREHTPQKSLECDVVGAIPCVPAYLAGEPECMYRQETVPSTVEIVDLIVDINASCDIAAADMMRRGVAVWQTIRRIEAAGKRVRAIAAVNIEVPKYRTYKSPKYRSQLNITLKKEGRSIDASRLVYAVAHPAFFRRQVFCAFERDSEFEHLRAVGESYGYGAVVDVARERDSQIILPGVDSGRRTVAEWVEVFEGAVDAAR
jgi:hypothetical protein